MKVNPPIRLGLFALVVLAQIYVPAKMIRDREDVLESGIDFKFRTAPIDPTDPFRGKYIDLSFEERFVDVDDSDDWQWGDPIFVELATDSLGYAQLVKGHKEASLIQGPYLQARILGSASDEVNVEFPFERFYMEESKAYEAEVISREARRDTSQVAYALVSIKDGEAVLKDVLIDGVPIAKLVEQSRE